MTEQTAEIAEFSSARSARTVLILGMISAFSCVVYFAGLHAGLISTRDFSRIFGFLLTRYDDKAAWALLAATCIAAFGFKATAVMRLVEWLGRRPVTAAAGFCLCYALGNVFVYHGFPLSMDEYAAVFQSKIFSSGHVVGQLPAQYFDWLVVRGFNSVFFAGSAQSGAIIEQYWPGFALILSLFDFFHMPWLCNPALAALALWLIHRITLELTGDPRAAGFAMLFALASGAFVAYAISYYSMQAHLTLNLLFAYLLLRPTRARAFAAGLTGSLALILHNPMPHAVFALPWLLATVSREKWRLLLPLGLGYAPGLLIGVVWVMLRTHISSASTTDAASVAASALHGVFAMPTAAMLNIRLASLAKLIVWSAPLLVPFSVIGFLRFRRSEGARLLGWSVLLTSFAYFFVTFDQGHGWGHRYFHSAWGVLPIFAGCSVAGLVDADSRLLRLAASSAAFGLLLMVPFQLRQIDAVIADQLVLLGPPRRPGNNVFFIHPGGGFYVADLVQMDPWLRQPDLFLVSRGAPLDEAMIKRNWPGAKKIAAAAVYDQWYLGDADVRSSLHTGESQEAFTLR